MKKKKDIIILCIGTNKIIGDSIGPIVGEKLEYILKNRKDIEVYGNIHDTLNCKNVNEKLEKIYREHKNPFIIAIDSALGKKEMIEEIYVSNEKMKIGKALEHEICLFPNISIKGIVGEYRKNLKENMQILKNVNEVCINNLTNKIIFEVCNLIENINNV